MHTITIKPDQAGERFEPLNPHSRYRPMKGTGGRFLLRLTDHRIVTRDHDLLTDEELAALRVFWKKAESKPQTPSDLDRLWAEKAIEQELDKIMGLHGDKPHKPDSKYWKCLCRIAGAVKGSGKAHYRPSDVLTELLRFSPQDMAWKLASREKDITYLWGRAMNRAPARYRQPN